MPRLPSVKSLSALVRQVKPYIRDDYRAYADDPGTGDEENIPSMLLTVGWDPDSGAWDYQTGDNSYSGSAYFYPCWAIVAIYRRSNSISLAREIREQLADLVCQ